MAGISYSGDDDINVSGADMSTKSGSTSSSSPVAKPSGSGSSGSVNNGVIGKNVNISGPVAMGYGTHVDNSDS